MVIGDNAWQTERVNRSAPGNPLERFIHLFDRGGSGQYTLTFDPDSMAPEVVSWQSVCDHGGEVGELGLEIDPAMPASDPRAAGIGKLVVTFSESVLASTFADTNVYVEGAHVDGGEVDLSAITQTVSLRSSEKVGVIEFSPPLPTNARYCITLLGVTDRSTNALTGEGVRIDLTSLPGDATGDRRVNNTDVGGIGSLLDTDPVSRDEWYHVRSDINCDGRIDQDDLNAARAARGIDARFAMNPCLEKGSTGVILDDAAVLEADPVITGPETYGRRGAGGLSCRLRLQPIQAREESVTDVLPHQGGVRGVAKSLRGRSGWG